MVIFLKDNSGQFIKANFQKGSELKEIYKFCSTDAEHFAAQAVRTVGPKNLLYVFQREMAVVKSSGPVALLGSEDATTCHLVILRNQTNSLTLLAHCDGSDTKSDVDQMLKKFNGESKLKLYLVGGFEDDRNLSIDLSKNLLRTFHDSPIAIEIHLACICRLNNILKEDSINWPNVYGIAMDVKTGEVFPAVFSSHEPCTSLRSLNRSSKLFDVFDSDDNRLVISPFNYDDQIYMAKYVLTKSDAWIRENVSTSPKVEPPGFVKHIRDGMQFIIDNPSSEIFFKNNSLNYLMDQSSGLWQLTEKI